MSSRRVERELEDQNPRNEPSRRRNQTWAPHQPIIFTPSALPADTHNASSSSERTAYLSSGASVYNRTQNGPSRSQQHLPARIWISGQDIQFAKDKEYWDSSSSTGASFSSVEKARFSGGESHVPLDSPPRSRSPTAAGSSKFKYNEKRPSTVALSDGSSLPHGRRFSPQIGRASALLSGNPPGLEPVLTRDFMRSKSTSSNTDARATFPRKSFQVLPSVSTYEKRAPGSVLRKTGIRPNRPTIPSAQSSLEVRSKEKKEAEVRRQREEMEAETRRRRENLANEQKAESIRRIEEEKRKRWEAPFREKLDRKYNVIFKRMENICADIRRLGDEIRFIYTILRPLYEKRWRAKDDIRRTIQQIRSIEAALKAAHASDLQVRWNRLFDKRRTMQLKLNKTRVHRSGENWPMNAWVLDDIENYVRAKSRSKDDLVSPATRDSMLQILPRIATSQQAIGHSLHLYRRYARLKFQLTHSPVPKAWAFETVLLPTLELAERLSDNARELLHLFWEFRRDLRRKLSFEAYKRYEAQVLCLSARFSAMLHDCDTIVQIVSRYWTRSGIVHHQYSERSYAILSRWQERTWGPFLDQIFQFSQIRAQLRAYVDVEISIKLVQSKREVQEALIDCIDASWARAAADYARGRLVFFRGKPNSFGKSVNDPDVYTHDREDLVVHRPFQLQQTSQFQNYWQFNRCRTSDGEKISVHLCTSVWTSERVARLFLQDDVLGFDLEWKPNSRKDDPDYVALLQLANKQHIALFHLSLMQLEAGMLSPPGEFLHHRIAPTLRAILMNRQVLKVGVNIKADSTRLANTFQFKMAGLFELSHLYRQLNYQPSSQKPINRRAVSLETQTKEYLGLPIAKGPERCSDWQHRLTVEQIFYAANDVYASLMLFWAMNEKRMKLQSRPSLPALAEDNKPIPIPGVTSPRTAETVPDAFESQDSVSERSCVRSKSGCVALETSGRARHSSGLPSALLDDTINMTQIPDSFDIFLDGQGNETRSVKSMRYAAEVAESWVTGWRAFTRIQDIGKKDLQMYFLAQIGWPLNDISLALKEADIDGIAQRLLNLSKRSNPKVNQAVIDTCRFRVCFGDRVDSMSAMDKSLVKANPQALERAQRWLRRRPERYRKVLLPYALKIECGLCLEDVALTLEMNAQRAAGYVLWAVRYLGEPITIGPLREIKNRTALSEMKTWSERQMQITLDRQPRGMLAMSQEDEIILDSWGGEFSQEAELKQRYMVLAELENVAPKRTRSSPTKRRAAIRVRKSPSELPKSKTAGSMQSSRSKILANQTASGAAIQSASGHTGRSLMRIRKYIDRNQSDKVQEKASSGGGSKLPYRAFKIYRAHHNVNVSFKKKEKKRSQQKSSTTSTPSTPSSSSQGTCTKRNNSKKKAKAKVVVEEGKVKVESPPPPPKKKTTASESVVEPVSVSTKPVSVFSTSTTKNRAMTTSHADTDTEGQRGQQQLRSDEGDTGSSSDVESTSTGVGGGGAKRRRRQRRRRRKKKEEG